MNDLPRAKKALGQHWLTDKPSLQAMVTSANVQPNDAILEIGPGTGTLTDELLAAGAKVTALEFDLNRVRDLENRYAKYPNKPVIEPGDIRTYDFNSLPKGFKVVANIPYYLTANLLRRFVDAENKPEYAVLLVQKEVAERVAAAPGDLSQIAVYTQLYYEVELGLLVPPHLFRPPPKVDSQILILKKRTTPIYELDATMLKVIKAGFSERRKKIKTSLAGGLGVPKPEVAALLETAAVNPDARAQELSLQDWHKLAEAFSGKIILADH